MSNVKFPMSKDTSFSPFQGEIKRGLPLIMKTFILFFFGLFLGKPPLAPPWKGGEN